jgi:hypothetical protein
MKRARRAVAFAFALVPLLPVACTTFDGVSARNDAFEAGTPVAQDAEEGKTVDAVREDAPAEGDAPAREAKPAMPGLLPDLATAARLCSRVHECSPLLAYSIAGSLGLPISGSNFSACVSWALAPVPASRLGRDLQARALACIAAAGSCAEAGGCLAYESIADDDPRCATDAGKSTRACLPNGDVVDCGYRRIEHCKDPTFGTSAKCAAKAALCADDGNCTAAANDCRLSNLEICNSGSDPDGVGVRTSFTCAVEGLACDTNGDLGFPDCVTAPGHPKPCTSVGMATCSGDLALVCNGAMNSQFDCAGVGGTCVPDEGVPRCKLPGDKCSPVDMGVNACDGRRIALCAAGQRAVFDCTTIGQRCVAQRGQRAACAP